MNVKKKKYRDGEGGNDLKYYYLNSLPPPSPTDNRSHAPRVDARPGTVCFISEMMNATNAHVIYYN